MSKRRRDDAQFDLPPTKRHRDAVTSPLDRLSSLSDEILLHILSFLPISSLNVCQRYVPSFGFICRFLPTLSVDCPIDSTLSQAILSFGNDSTIPSGFALEPVA